MNTGEEGRRRSASQETSLVVGKNGHEPDASFRTNCEGLGGGAWMSAQDGDALELFLKQQVIEFLTGLWRFCAASRWLTEKALEYREIIGQFRRFLTGRLQQGTRVFEAMLTYDVGHRM